MQRLAELDLLDELDGPAEVRPIAVARDLLPGQSVAGQAIVPAEIPAAGRWDTQLAEVVVWDLGPGDALLAPDALDGVTASVVALVADGTAATPLLAAGVCAVLPRTIGATALDSAVQSVRHGLTVVDPALLSLAANAPSGAVDQTDKPASANAQLLTPREEQVLELLADGISNKAIAASLGVSGHTAKFHIAAIMLKLDADTRTEAVVTALRRGLLAL